MNQNQRKKRVARIRQEQELARRAKSQPQIPAACRGVDDLAKTKQEFTEAVEDIAGEHFQKSRRSAKIGMVLSPILVILAIIFVQGNEWIAAVCAIVASFPWIIYLLHSDSLAIWRRFAGEIRASL